ncbi:transcriptional regulator with XRE-family HTH domain [Kibdelosporangium banguiense]|uniref:Transcriptional regulator with XRE-family HTH domain n=1 Tax=Kibdelosporangium banguiense TaxID=1365924 RepID=A0ABS4TN63_9PSEU|nr:helix-turn-helix transcriptional regulator [Kibdelosporangium banguiense]MBP2325358.1 transcriptional regulator with XRE-family HTH domain [Kibdelosporangium banguiense]
MKSGSHANPKSHVRALVDSDPRSVKQIERDAGLREGTIAYYLKPSSPDTKRPPSLDVVERFAAALGVDVLVVSRAFIRDAGLPSDGEEITPGERQLIQRYRALTETDQARLRGILECFEQFPHQVTPTQHAAGC